MLYGIIVIIRVIIICAPTREASGWRSVGSTRAGSRFRGVRFPRTKGGPRISRSEDSYCAKFLLCEVEVFVLDMFILHTSARGVCVCVCSVDARAYRAEVKTFGQGHALLLHSDRSNALPAYLWVRARVQRI